MAYRGCYYFGCKLPITTTPPAFCTEHYQELLKSIEAARDLKRSEPKALEGRTCLVVIRRALIALGWGVRAGGYQDWREQCAVQVTPRGTARLRRLCPDMNFRPHWGVMDFALYDQDGRGQPSIVVEAKGIYVTLNECHEEQLRGYLESSEAPRGVLTNGYNWRFYRLENGGLVDEYKFHMGQRHAARALIRGLGKS